MSGNYSQCADIRGYSQCTDMGYQGIIVSVLMSGGAVSVPTLGVRGFFSCLKSGVLEKPLLLIKGTVLRAVPPVPFPFPPPPSSCLEDRFMAAILSLKIIYSRLGKGKSVWSGVFYHSVE